MGAPDSGVSVNFSSSNCTRQAPCCETLPPAFRYWNFPLKSGIRSGHLIAAFRTELGGAFHLGAAAAALVFRTQWLTALRAELCALSMRAAGRAQGHSLAGQVHVFGEVLVLEFHLHLVNGGLHLG